MKLLMYVCLLSVSVHFVSQAQEGKKEPFKYLGEPQPGLTPMLFASGTISLDNRYEFGNTFSIDGKEFFYATEVDRKPEIWTVRLVGNAWTKPEKILTHDKYGYNDPFLSPDGKKLFFISDRAIDGMADKKDIDIWYVERTKSGWSEPINAGPVINTNKNEYYISFTKKGTMYFSSNGGTTAGNDKNYDIRYAELTDGKFQTSKKLGPAVNTDNYEADVYISPDESYIIFCSERPDNKGGGDLYISFKNANGQWAPAKNMESVNTAGYEFCPYVTSDQKFLFFSRSGEIYWVSSDVIEKYR